MDERESGALCRKVICEGHPTCLPKTADRSFLAGEGYIVDPSHGGLLMYSGIPACVVAELTRVDFRLLQVLPDNYPGRDNEYSTRWYYYAVSKD